MVQLKWKLSCMEFASPGLWVPGLFALPGSLSDDPELGVFKVTPGQVKPPNWLPCTPSL